MPGSPYKQEFLNLFLMNDILLLTLSAASLGFIHTILGPDHYLPFIVLSKARKWSQSKTLWITFISGIGHVSSSVIIGFIGIAMGISLHKLKAIESIRGEIVAYMLITFGIIYSAYGIYKIVKKGSHFHLPAFLKPKSIRKHHDGHLADEIEENDKKFNVTPWILFLIFVFGPCEVLIPMLILPAFEHSVAGVLMVAIVFGMTTILTMLAIVYQGYKGLGLIKLGKKEHYFHLLAGLVILVSGVGIEFLGW